MRMYDIITTKQNAGELSKKQIDFFIKAYTEGSIPDYQASALLMAIYLNGMTDTEITDLTMAMAYSGDIMDLSPIKGVKVDKHSTGGVGDKTTLIVAPIVASLGVRVAKLSGKGLGYTGGTIDKMESIPGVKTNITESKFFDIVNTVGCSVISQTSNLAPADKKLYALRDVTATVSSIPLIASSIMSKKIASGSDCILLDVKVGSGAFMKSLDDAILLAQTMVKIGHNLGKKTMALITNMDSPLGCYIGNSLEIAEVCETLKGKGPADLTQISIELAANMLQMAGMGDIYYCKSIAQQQITNKQALAKLKEMISAQGGRLSTLDYEFDFPKAECKYQVLATTEGYIYSIDAEKCGMASVILGAGRIEKDAPVDYDAGIIFHKKTGDKVHKFTLIATLCSSSKEKCLEALSVITDAVTISDVAPKEQPLILCRVTPDYVDKLYNI